MKDPERHKVILYTAQQIAARVNELGRMITDYYEGKPLTVIVLLNGGMIFAADLIRNIRLPIWLDTLSVTSYRDDRSTGNLEFHSHLRLPLAGRHILIVDDIFDTGYTLSKVSGYLQGQGAISVRTCALLDKQIPQEKKAPFKIDWFGFRIPDVYVVGYGLDSNEEFRQLPDIEYVTSEPDAGS